MIASLISLLIAAADDQETLTLVRSRLGDFYNELNSMKVTYVETWSDAVAPPSSRNLRIFWDRLHATGSLPCKGFPIDEHIFTYVTPWMRRDTISTITKDAVSKTTRSTMVLYRGEIRSYSHSSNSGVASPAKGLAGFERTPLTRIGRILPGSLSTSWHELISLPNIVKVSQGSETAAKSPLLVSVGPGIPERICAGWFGATGRVVFHFADGSRLFPDKVEYFVPLSGARGRPDEESNSMNYEQLILKNLQNVKYSNSKEVIRFPFEMRLETPFSTSTWTIKAVELNGQYSPKLFEVGDQKSSFVVNEKIPTANKSGSASSRINHIKESISRANELISDSENRAIESAISGIGWLVLGGTCSICLGAGLLLLRARRDS